MGGRKTVGHLKPVFIIGGQRSGTTMLASILGSARGCVALPEADFKFQFVGVQARSEQKKAAVLRAAALERTFRLWGLKVSDLSGETLRELFTSCITVHLERNGRTGEIHTWIDHTNLNFRFPATLAAEFPDARFVHLVRDGRAAMASVLPLDWGPNDVIHAAQWWNEAIAFGLGAEELLGDRIIRVHYEDIVANSASAVKGICAFLEIPFAESMLSGNAYPVLAYTRKQHALVGTSPEPSRVDRWRTVLEPRQIALFERKTGELLTCLGYTKSGYPVTSLSGIEKVSLLWKRMIRGRIINRLRRRRRQMSHFTHG